MKQVRRPQTLARPEAPAPPRRDRDFFAPAAAIAGVALAVRLLHLWLMRASPYFSVLLGDSAGYDAWARRLAAGDWIGTEVFYQAPLYPYVMGLIYTVAGPSPMAVRVVQAVLGAASCTLVGLAAHRAFSRRVGVAAGVGLALYAPAIFFDGLLQKASLDLFFVALALYLITRIVDQAGDWRTWLGLGATMGGLSLTRENALVFIVVLLASISRHPSSARTSTSATTRKPTAPTCRCATAAARPSTNASTPPNWRSTRPAAP